MTYFTKYTTFFIFFIFLNILNSCASKKNVVYFNQGAESDYPKIDATLFTYKIQSNDILSIKILSLDLQSSVPYNLVMQDGTTGNVNNLELTKINSYLVGTSGEIILPVLGSINVVGKTTDELSLFLKSMLIDQGHLNSPNVIVRLVNSKFTVLGEVKNAGTFNFTENNLTLLQALGVAGDLTIYGDRKQVLLIREQPNGKRIFNVDFTKTDWFTKEEYIIKPNDVIIVNPNNAKIKSSGIIGNPSILISLASLLLTGILLSR